MLLENVIITQCDVISMIFAYQTKLNISRTLQLQKFYQRGYVVISSDLYNTTRKRSTQFCWMNTLSALLKNAHQNIYLSFVKAYVHLKKLGDLMPLVYMGSGFQSFYSSTTE